MNNTVFLRWFESARITYLERIGFPAKIRADGQGPILAAVHCNYRSQLKYPDTVRIGARVTKIGTTSAHISQVVFSRAQQAIVADGESIVVFYDYRTKRPIPIPDPLRAAIEKLQNAVE